MKKRILLLALVMIAVFTVTACGKPEETAKDAEVAKVDFEYTEQDFGGYEIPIVMPIPKIWEEHKNEASILPVGKGTETGVSVAFIPKSALTVYEEIKNDESLSEEEKATKVREKVMQGLVTVSSAVVTDKGPERLESLKEEMGYSQGKVVEEKDGKTLIYLWSNWEEVKTEGFTEEDIASMKEIFKPVPKLGDVMKISEAKTAANPDGIAGIKNWSFTAKDLEGKEVTQEIFKENKITLVNIWGTFCGPCKVELPELAKLSEKYSGKVGFVGIVSDVPEGSSEGLDLAKKILSDSGVKFTNLLIDDKLAEVTRMAVGVPTTFFVDGEGNVVGDVLVGARGAEDFSKVIDKLLED
ncbi:MAG: TlpA family protein disulfide reductase [Tissierellia bacterium]|nr:TlpA family protein disulfide reductase [Tissierellia bacterium]